VFCLLTSSIVVKREIYRAVKYKFDKLPNLIIKGNPTKCTFSELIFLFMTSSACFEEEISFSEDDCIYKYVIGRFTCISISSLKLMHV